MTNTFKPGQTARRKATARNNGVYAVGGEPFIIEHGNESGNESGGYVLDPNGGLHDPVNLELVEPVRAFKVGDIVKLTGAKWDGDHTPVRGTEHTVIAIEGNGSIGKINAAKTAGERDIWYVYAATGDHFSPHWGAEIVTPEPDATGYPVGTPREAKAVPETADVKVEFAGGDTAKLALFNRWYERELEEAREDASTMAFVNGHREGFKAGWDKRGELEAADLADWERELLGLNTAPKPVVVQSAREFVEALPVGTRIRTSVERGSTEYVRVPDGILVTKESPDQPRGDFGKVYSLPGRVSTDPNFYEIIE